jgi:hypothetical protein
MRILTLTLIALTLGASEAPYIWQQDQAKIIPTGDLTWQPEEFIFESAGDVRYIDYDNGDDTSQGTRETPWRHHPWDPAATGAAAAGGGVDTYVFKGGVIYRGHIVVPDRTSGSDEMPIRLTRDPDWGEGQAWIYGSQAVRDWKHGSRHDDIPEATRVWTAELDFAPRALWMVDEAGSNTRIHLAREPDWEISDPRDPLSEWWQWENPNWWKHDYNPSDPRAVAGLKRGLYGIDTTHLTEDADYYEGATVRTEWGILMANPMPSVIEHFHEEAKAISFVTPFLGPGRIIRGHRYFLEDKPHYLDQAGEFWFQKRDKGGTLHLRRPNDIDPNSVHIEAPRHINLIDADSVSHLHITGLGFRFCNYHWQHADFIFQHEDVLGAAVRMLGGGEDVRVANCVFEHVNRAVRVDAQAPDQDLDRIVISDNDIRFCDQAGITARNHAPRNSDSPERFSRLIRLHILRNRLHEVNLRNARMDHTHAIDTLYPELAVVAGNVISRTWGGGIQIVAAKGDGQPIDTPLARILVFHNRTEETLLAACDWGAIRIVQGGDGYIFNNVVRDPGGYSHWRGIQGKPEGTPRFGFAYYLDGAYKHSVFNNIAWSPNNELGSKYANEAAFQTLISFENAVFNNSAFRYVDVTRNQSPQLGRWHYLGNIYQDISGHVFRLGNPPKQESQNQADVATGGDDHDLATFAFDNNVFYDISGDYGLFIDKGPVYQELDAMRAAMHDHQLMRADIGMEADKAPMRDPAAMDFRPSADSAAIDRGVRYFLPWGLSAVVGEWHFRRNMAHPQQITDHHWYMQGPYGWRNNYIDMPRWPLHADWATTDSYQQGPLEDWIPGALAFSGQPAVLPHTDLLRGASYTPRRSKQTESIQAERFVTVDMGSNNFLIELHLRVDAGTAGDLVTKYDGSTGYRLRVDAQGSLRFILNAHGTESQLEQPAALADGAWHHLIVEADRTAGSLRCYLDSSLVGESACRLPESASLANKADFLVGDGLHGAIEFLRVSRGSLRDAQTSIEELYAWQFDGPHLRDFTDHAPVGAGRDAGAIEAR